MTPSFLRAILICAWAEKGADALGPDGVIIHSDAFPPESLVDTLGAGDTFNAAVIYTLSKGKTFKHLCSRKPAKPQYSVAESFINKVLILIHARTKPVLTYIRCCKCTWIGSYIILFYATMRLGVLFWHAHWSSQEPNHDRSD